MLRRHPLSRVAACLALVVALGAGAAFHGRQTLARFVMEDAQTQLLSRARMLEPALVDALQRDPSEPALDSLVRETARQSGMSITVTDASGRVLADHGTPLEPDRDIMGATEMAQALRSGEGRAVRRIPSERDRYLFAAVTLDGGNGRAGMLRLAYPASSVDERLGGLYRRFIWFAALAAAVVAAGILLAARWASAQVEKLGAAMDRLAQGELGPRVPAMRTMCLNRLARSLNTMAEAMEGRIQEEVRRRREIEGVLASMEEAVVAVDPEEHILNLNRVAADLFGVPAQSARGRTLQEVVRNPELQRVMQKTLATREQLIEEDIVLYGQREVHLHARGTVLRDPEDGRAGALIVLSDVTSLRRLESARSDFVGNVSHEIKTPITSIKGYVETLLDGAADDPANRERFLQVIKRQTDRLATIVDDILTLSFLDKERDRERDLDREEVCAAELVASAAGVCRPRAAEKGVSVQVACEPDLRVSVAPALFEQALVNLIDNAVKYSEAGTDVEVSVEAADEGTWFRVRDHGCGISRADLPRIFERFFRVDKARSRTLGGTGLGLAIVKHIVRQHGGRVEVESALGKGSEFSIHLPSAPPLDAP